MNDTVHPLVLDVVEVSGSVEVVDSVRCPDGEAQEPTLPCDLVLRREGEVLLNYFAETAARRKL